MGTTATTRRGGTTAANNGNLQISRGSVPTREITVYERIPDVGEQLRNVRDNNKFPQSRDRPQLTVRYELQRGYNKLRVIFRASRYVAGLQWSRDTYLRCQPSSGSELVRHRG